MAWNTPAWGRWGGHIFWNVATIPRPQNETFLSYLCVYGVKKTRAISASFVELSHMRNPLFFRVFFILYSQVEAHIFISIIICI